MFEFLKRKTTTLRSMPDSSIPPLFFKDEAAAFEYACLCLQCPLNEGGFLPALVLDARQLIDVPTAVNVDSDGHQLAMLHVASSDGGFLVTASTISPKGPRLQPGLLVAWKALKYMPEVAGMAEDKRFGWAGLIVSTLKPEYVDGCWVANERYLL